ncbi:MAG: RMD1 family protein [Negativicutes bacterium]|nr:RMD1 family protein [Negativicutes bacterium]
MSYAELKAIVASNEFSLEKIATHFGISRKFKWEETLVLREEELKGIIRDPAEKQMRLFHFGCVVFNHFSNAEITDVVNYLRRIDINLFVANPFEYSDDYRIEVDPAATPAFNNDFMVIAAAEDHLLGIVSTILAKSVALERLEASINSLLDEVEEIVGYLHRGSLTVSDETLAQLSAQILGFKLNTISYIMLLDKPVVTWSNNQAAELYDELCSLFELSDRYETGRHKIDTLMDITEVFGGLVHAKRGTKLEWAIIVLITIEILLQVSDKLIK